jgi:hypothetical protein
MHEVEVFPWLSVYQNDSASTTSMRTAGASSKMGFASSGGLSRRYQSGQYLRRLCGSLLPRPVDLARAVLEQSVTPVAVHSH